MLVMETEKLADTFMVLMSQFLFLKASWIKRVYHLNGAGVIHKNQRECDPQRTRGKLAV